MDPLETKWSSDKLKWVEVNLQNKSIPEIHKQNIDFDLLFYFYGTVWDCGIGYRYLVDKEPKSNYWKYFVSAYFKALQNRNNIISQYEKKSNGPKTLLTSFL